MIDLIARKFTFTWLEFQVMLSEAYEHHMQASQMLFLGFGEGNYIIQVD